MFHVEHFSTRHKKQMFHVKQTSIIFDTLPFSTDNIETNLLVIDTARNITVKSHKNAPQSDRKFISSVLILIGRQIIDNL